MGRLGIRIANALLASLCGLQVAGVVTRISEDSLTPSFAAYDPAAPVAEQAVRTWDDRKTILERNLFGAQILAVALEPEPEEQLEETKLPVELVGTLLSDVPSKSSAAISEQGHPDPEVLYTGDRLARHPEVEVAEIERGRVVLKNGARREELLLSEEALATPNAAAIAALDAQSRSARRISARRSPRPEPSETPSPASIAEQLKELQAGGSNLAGAQDLFSQARITPKWDEGEMTGMEVRDIVPGSLYEKIGLSDGDVIESFNGIKLDSTAAGAEVLQQFGTAEEFEIVLSDGTVKKLRSDQIQGLLEAAGTVGQGPH